MSTRHAATIDGLRKRTAARAPARVPADKSSAFTILIIDADDKRRALLADLLRKDGFAATVLANGHEAAKVLITGAVDLLITAVLLPGMDGLELLQIARSVDQSLPVIVMSDGDTRIHSIYLRCAESLGATKTYPVPTRFRTIREDVRHLSRLKAPAGLKAR